MHPPPVLERSIATVNSLCNDCFGNQKLCPYIALSLLRGTTAVRMQRLVTNGAVLTSSVLTTRVYCSILVALQDPLSNAVARAKELENACRNVEVQMLNAGHCPHDEVPHLVNQGLLDFVQKISDKSGQRSDDDAPLKQETAAV